MSSIIDLILQGPSAADRFQQIMPFLQSSTSRGGGGIGSMVSGAGNVAPYQGGLPAQDLAIQIARKLERKGFQVGGLEGWQGQGPISSGHIDNSQHYSGMAGDVNYYGDGRWNNEQAALSWVENWLNRKYGNAITENIWQEPGHYDHLHYGTRPGG